MFSQRCLSSVCLLANHHQLCVTVTWHLNIEFNSETEKSPRSHTAKKWVFWQNCELHRRNDWMYSATRSCWTKFYCQGPVFFSLVFPSFPFPHVGVSVFVPPVCLVVYVSGAGRSLEISLHWSVCTPAVITHLSLIIHSSHLHCCRI